SLCCSTHLSTDVPAFFPYTTLFRSYDRGRQPFGTWVATRLITTPQWSVREDINHDVAAAVVAPVNGRRLTEVVGGQGIAFNQPRDRKSTRLNSSHVKISYAVFCLNK